jgi:hypothetical protein
VLQQRVDVTGDCGHTRRFETAHGVAPLDVLDLDHLGAPVRHQGRSRRHERVLGDLDDADAFQDADHRISSGHGDDRRSDESMAS